MYILCELYKYLIRHFGKEYIHREKKNLIRMLYHCNNLSMTIYGILNHISCNYPKYNLHDKITILTRMRKQSLKFNQRLSESKMQFAKLQ